jgi:UDP-2,3-diacylglucosamine pyrophosphatase LpxH
MSNYQRIHNSLDRLFSKSARKKVQINDLRWVVFSDHHRGNRDEADDFEQCESTYLKALEYYQQEQYGLLLLGDVDEFWENNVWAPVKAYSEVLKSEARFYQRNQFIRIWGNHDDFWRTPFAFSQFLSKSFPSAKIMEQVCFEVMDGDQSIGEMLFVHGHQGSKGSDRFAALSRFIVRYVWRFFQKTFKFKLSTPRYDLGLRSVTDHALYNWAEKNKVALVCGHTHQPVFMSGSRLDKIDEELKTTTDVHRIDALKMEMALRVDEITRIQAGITRIPCYFNAGCCSFADGDITGLEIADGEMRLIKWISDSNKKIVLDRQDLRTIFKSIVSKT